MSSGRSTTNFRMHYPGYMGGVTGFTPKQYETINGFSNLFFGWGGEDDNLETRISKMYPDGYSRISNKFGR